MTDIVLTSSDPRLMLSHLAFYGLAGILSEAGGVRCSWTDGMAPHPRLTGDWITPLRVAEEVRKHAGRHADSDSWIAAAQPGDPKRGLMSPRIATVGSADRWRDLQHARHTVLDELTTRQHELDLRLVGALGEPAYWRLGIKPGEARQDDGASRLEMQPRNQGSEFVGSRLRPIGRAVAARTVEQVLDGLLGRTVVDEVGGNAPDSRSGTGFTAPGPVDNSLVWCALWGIAHFPIAQRPRSTAITTGHVGRAAAGYFYVPAWRGQWSPARLRSVLTDASLRTMASLPIPATGTRSPIGEAAARRWLLDRGVRAVIRFEIRRYGSDSAPERRTQLGQVARLDGER